MKMKKWKTLFVLFGMFFSILCVCCLYQILKAYFITHDSVLSFWSSFALSSYGLYMVFINYGAVVKYKASDSIAEQMKDEWERYLIYLRDKYPSENWQLTCPYHRNIDELIKKI